MMEKYINLKENFELERTKIEYCPQEDLLFNNYIVKEIFEFIQSLLGINIYIEEFSEQFNLNI